jgi:ribose/xylose/arabinose/galactoside ABC-type transport system permease subunit
MRKLLSIWEKYGMIVLIAGMMIMFTILTDKFLTVNNLMNVLRQASILGTVAIGVTFVMISGGTDLSVGSVAAFVGVVCARLMMAGMDMVLVAIIGVAVGILASTINGILAVVLKTTSLIITLAAMNVWAGMAFILAEGKTLYEIPAAFSKLSQSYVLGIPVLGIYFVILAVIGLFVLSKTYFGRYVYAIGGNKEAAHLAGINTTKMVILTHVICGVFVGIAGVLLLSRTMTAQGSSAGSYAFDCLTAACLGGIRIGGGKGKVSGAVLGVLVINLMFNGMTLIGVNDYYQQIVKGLVLIFAITIDALRMYYQAGDKSGNDASKSKPVITIIGDNIRKAATGG